METNKNNLFKTLKAARQESRRIINENINADVVFSKVYNSPYKYFVGTTEEYKNYLASNPL